MAGKMKQNQFYCVSCRKRVMISPEDICVKKAKNGTPMMKAVDKYGHKCNKFIKQSDYSKLATKYGKC